MGAADSTFRLPAAPALSSRSLADALLAGAVGLLVWEAFARGLAPLWLGHPLDPTGLVEMALGVGGTGAQAIHLATGLLAYPLAYLFAVRPAAAAVAPGLPAWVLGLGYGLALWVFAMGVVAGLWAGMPPFLGFGAVAWASLAGHLLLGLAIAETVRWRRRGAT